MSPKYGYQRNLWNVDVTLLFAILTKNALFRSYGAFLTSFMRISYAYGCRIAGKFGEH